MEMKQFAQVCPDKRGRGETQWHSTGLACARAWIHSRHHKGNRDNKSGSGDCRDGSSTKGT